MSLGDIGKELQTLWEEWHALQYQIKDIEYLIAQNDEFLEQYQTRLAYLRAHRGAAQKRFEKLLKKLQK